MSCQVVIVDYGTGNLNSIMRRLDRMGVNAVISSIAADIARSDKLILPGVGHFSRAMDSLKRRDLIDPLNEAVLVKRKPVLGICLGMELMARASEEGNTRGFGWFDADVVRFGVANKLKYKIPHIGWNRIRIRKESALMKGVEDLSEFYFVHSYYLKLKNAGDMLNETVYEFPYPSAIEKENIFGVQYHPEKSRDAGARLLKNFVEL